MPSLSSTRHRFGTCLRHPSSVIRLPRPKSTPLCALTPPQGRTRLEYDSAVKSNVATGTRLDETVNQDLAVKTLELTVTKLIMAELTNTKEHKIEAKLIQLVYLPG